MDLVIAALLSGLGAIVASFMGVVVARLNTGESIVRGRSRCDVCGATLSASAMVPVVSYLFSRGRARCCGARISFIAPLTELLLGVLFVLAYIRVGFTLALPFYLAALALLLALVLYDLAHQILPPVLLSLFVLASAIAGVLAAASFADFEGTLVIAFLTAGSLALINLLSRGRAMGFSDAPLTFGLALLTGPAAFPGFVYSFWIGALIGIILLARRPAGSRMGVEVPFAPFLAAGFLLAFITQWNPFLIATALLP